MALAIARLAGRSVRSTCTVPTMIVSQAQLKSAALSMQLCNAVMAAIAGRL